MLGRLWFKTAQMGRMVQVVEPCWSESQIHCGDPFVSLADHAVSAQRLTAAASQPSTPSHSTMKAYLPQ